MKKIVIMGAGFTGLSAAHRLVQSGIPVTIIEKEKQPGGLSRTFSFEGVSFDLGPHVFFRQDAKVRAYWRELLGRVLVTHRRSSRVFVKEGLIHSPLRPFNAIRRIGLTNLISIFASYFKFRFSRVPKDGSSRTWIINRFGKKLYDMFFEEYNRKLFGISASQISESWAAKRVEFSFIGIIRAVLLRDKNRLVKEFDAAVGGSGQMINAICNQIEKSGCGTFKYGKEVVRIQHMQACVLSVDLEETVTGERETVAGTEFISSMPIDLLVRALDPQAPAPIREAADALTFRNLVTVNFLIPKTLSKKLSFHWIDVHDSNIRAMRVTNFGVFQKSGVDGERAALAVEYVVSTNETCSDEGWFDQARKDLLTMLPLASESLQPAMILRLDRAYPVYEIGYEEKVARITDYLAGFKNLNSVGRGGSFQYNNMHHAVQAGWKAAEALG